MLMVVIVLIVVFKDQMNKKFASVEPYFKRAVKKEESRSKNVQRISVVAQTAVDLSSVPGSRGLRRTVRGGGRDPVAGPLGGGLFQIHALA
jgi:hypothetical protein